MRPTYISAGLLIGFFVCSNLSASAQQAPEADAKQISERLADLQQAVAKLRKDDGDLRHGRLIADVDVFAKAAEWILRHGEFYTSQGGKGPSQYPKYTLDALETGRQRAQSLAAGETPWVNRIGSTIRGYDSKVDGSVQPYALTLPHGFEAGATTSWPLHVKLHGRGATLNEVRFIHDHEGKPAPEGQTWLQLDIFGRTNNAYRFSGETDVFEAIADVKRRYRIDSNRITLWGFSMGGAGSWHLGLHHPSLWSSVGPGAGFVDFYTYQKQAEPLPPHQHKPLHIYDSIDYALNAFNVPICTYGGELDPQVAAGTSVVESAKRLDVPIKLLIGPQTAHQFHPDSFKEFMAFHQEHSAKGRPSYPGRSEIRFITYTLKYNTCEWLTIEELLQGYEPAIVQSRVDPDSGILKLKTKNVAALQLARDVAYQVEIDGTVLPLTTAADGLLPGVYYELGGDEWHVLSYEDSRKFSTNPDLRKRHNLQGPIDDAFMEPFLCVRGTGTPWSPELHDFAHWTLERFSREFDKWFRGRVPVVNDVDVTVEQIEDKNLILFGDPGSNAVLAKVLDRLPVEWTTAAIDVNGRRFDTQSHGLALIYPNPLNPQRYVVINSGHTFHHKNFEASNAWLFPRLGDIAVQKFEKQPSGDYTETTVWADLFNASWRLPVRTAEASQGSTKKSDQP